MILPHLKSQSVSQKSSVCKLNSFNSVQSDEEIHVLLLSTALGFLFAPHGLFNNTQLSQWNGEQVDIPRTEVKVSKANKKVDVMEG